MRWLWVIPIAVFAGLFFGFDWLTGPAIEPNAERGRTFFMLLFAAGLMASLYSFLKTLKT